MIVCGIKNTSVTQQEQLISGRTTNSVAFSRLKGMILRTCGAYMFPIHYVIGYNVI